MRERRRILEATAAAALLSGGPSALASACRHRAVGPAIADLRQATRAAGTLVPPGRPGILRGALAHLVVSAACGELLGRTLPSRHSVAWGAGAGLSIGVINLVFIGRRLPAIRALPLTPQLLDNLAFGLVFAAVADR